MVGNVTILVVPASVNQDTPESTVKQGFALREFMVSSVIKSAPATCPIPGGRLYTLYPVSFSYIEHRNLNII